ncbi:MAG: hypothetical protein K2W96_05350 [Gemmataceae bacterium]|nr:hypothetical protein [Gemmataceae bacterium]
MLRYSCDGCGKELGGTHARHVVKIEVFAAPEAGALTDDDLDQDNLEAVAELIAQAEDGDGPPAVEPSSASLRYDLCPGCRRRFLRDPLAREAAPKFQFSKN